MIISHPAGKALLDDDRVFHLVRPMDELDEIKSKRGSIKDKSMTKAITEIYLTRLLSVKVKKKKKIIKNKRQRMNYLATVNFLRTILQFSSSKKAIFAFQGIFHSLFFLK